MWFATTPAKCLRIWCVVENYVWHGNCPHPSNCSCEAIVIIETNDFKMLLSIGIFRTDYRERLSFFGRFHRHLRRPSPLVANRRSSSLMTFDVFSDGHCLCPSEAIIGSNPDHRNNSWEFFGHLYRQRKCNSGRPATIMITFQRYVLLLLLLLLIHMSRISILLHHWTSNTFNGTLKMSCYLYST